MNRIDEITKRESEIFVRGWIFEPEKVVSSYYYEEKGTKYKLTGFGFESPDLIGSFGEEASRSRFEFTIPVPEPNGILVFCHEDSSTTIIPLSKYLDTANGIVPKVHQIENGRYYGGFEIVNPIEIVEVVVSLGAPDSQDSIRIPKKEFNPAPLRIGSIEPLDPELKIIYVDKEVDPHWSIDEINVHFIESEGIVHSLTEIGNSCRNSMEAYLIPYRFFQWLENSPKTLSILELGSRARSGNTVRENIPTRHNYLGFDLLVGPNVDVVGDAHRISEIVENDSLDAVFGLSFIEHLAMPWKFALELNRILRLGGRAMFFTHQSWPLHDAPFDFWRFSKESWKTIFNQSSGFRILDAAIGDEGRLHPEIQTAGNQHLSDTYCYLVSTVLIEKIGDTKLVWDVPLEEVYDGCYPE